MDSALPALNIDPLRYGLQTNEIAAQAQQAQQQSQLGAFEVQRQQALLPLEIKAARNKQLLEDQQTNNSLISQVVRDTMAADPEQRAQIWDRGMQDAAQNGATAASQYVGHYRDDLAQNLADYYGGASGAGRTSRESAIDARADQAKTDAIDRQVAQMAPDQLAMSMKKAQLIINSFNNVHDRQSWEQEIQFLQQNGINPASVMPSTEYSPLNYAAVKQRIQDNLVPYMRSMMNRSGILGIGAKPPAPAPLGQSQYIGTDPDTGKPLYHNPQTNEDVEGPYKVGPKPTAALSLFQYKYQMAQRNGMSEEDAMQFANGRKSLPPERLRAIATTEANKALADVSLSGATIPNPDAWVRAKTEEIYSQLTSAQTQPTGPRPGGAPAAASAQPPQRAVDALKKANGQPVTFSNQQVWVWRNGRAIRIK